MVRISVLHDALKTMYNAEKRGKRQVLIRPSSKVVIKFLQVMMKHGKSADIILPSHSTTSASSVYGITSASQLQVQHSSVGFQLQAEAKNST